MSKPKVTTTCDRCGKRDERALSDTKNSVGSIYASWLPENWRNHVRESAEYTLCDQCEEAYADSIADFVENTAS